MKLIIHSPERKEYVHLPERESEDWPREIRNAEFVVPESVSDRELLGHSSDVPKEHEYPGDVFENDFSNDDRFDGQEEHFEDSEEHTSWKHSKWTGALLVGAIIALGMILYLASRSDRGLSLSSVRVEGASLVTNEEILRLANIDRSTPFYDINLKQIESRLRTHSLIRSARVTRELDPPTLVLSVEERQPVAILRSDSTIGVGKGETYLIDRDGRLLRPKLIAGLRDPIKLLQVPLVSGVTAKDTMAFQAMAKMVTFIASLDSGALRNAIGELHRAPTGAFVLYTSETVTPIFLGSPFDREFRTVLEEQGDTVAATHDEPLFYRQLDLLARLWKAQIQKEVRAGHALYIDARFDGQIIVKQRFSTGTDSRIIAGTVPNIPSNSVQYATNANQRSTH